MAKFLERIQILLLLLSFSAAAQPLEKVYLQGRSYHPDTLTRHFKQLAEHPQASWHEISVTDAGRPLGVLVLGQGDETLGFPMLQPSKPRLLILNGIHPGESCGMDASLHLADSILRLHPDLLQRVSIAIVPVYNSGGSLQRSCCSRANQRGPQEQGFRGNRQNLDLNRDLIKADAPNTRAFYRLVQLFQPDFFLDTHTTDGADYPYAMTLLFTQPDRLGGELGKKLRNDWAPKVYASLKQQGEEAVPYVNVFGDDPLKGFDGFMDSPRYTTGYMALMGVPGVVSEAHMLKSYKRRVEATLKVQKALIDLLPTMGPEIRKARVKDRTALEPGKPHPLTWALDTTKATPLPFTGYTYERRPSTLGNYLVSTYDTARPVSTTVPFREWFKPVETANVPVAYLIPGAYQEVLDRLRMNGVAMTHLEADTTVLVRMSYLSDFKPGRPWEGHFLWQGGSTQDTLMEVRFYAGDAVVTTRQPAGKFVVEVLEPLADDSYFRWNFFDAVMDQKEWFSPYLFEPVALDMLQGNPELRLAWEQHVAEHPEVVESAWATLLWFYERSPYKEKTHRLYPVGRLVQ